MVQRDRYGENWGLKPVIFGFAVCTYQGRGRASGNPAGVVVQYRRASSSIVRLPTSTPSPRPMKGLHDLAPRRRRASEGSQAGGIRRFAVRRPPRGRLGSVLVARKRRHRMRGRLHWWIQISTGESSYLVRRVYVQGVLEPPARDALVDFSSGGQARLAEEYVPVALDAPTAVSRRIAPL